MKISKTIFALSLLAGLGLCASSGTAATVASTNFDGQTQSGNTASDLNWTLNGVDDPGSMAALNEAGNPQNLFTGNALVQNLFIPGINTGNGNTFWTTEVSLTVSAGATVTLTDVTFDYWAVNGGQNQNVNRQSDFTITISDPSSTVIEAVTIADSLNGTGVSAGAGTPVTATFTSPIALTAPGTYTLEIKGGDFIGFNETGNHTGIDNLSINGVVVPEPSTVLLGSLALLALLRHRRS